MKYIAFIFFLLSSSISFAHFPTRDIEMDYHNVNYGQILTKTMVEVVQIGQTLVSVPNMDNDHLYLVLDGCSSLNPACSQRLKDYAHDLVVSDIGCKEKYEYLGLKDVTSWNSYYQATVHYYWFVHKYTENVGWLASTVTIDSNNVRNYHLYIQNYTYTTDFVNWTYHLAQTGQFVLPGVRIDKYLGMTDYQCSSYYPDDPMCSYFAKYQFYKSWFSDFTFDQYRDAVGSDKYYIQVDIPGLQGCYWSYYIETFFIVPQCVNKDNWQLALCRREPDGTLWCASQSQITWKFYGRPSFSSVPSVFIKDLTQGQLAKADFIQDETVYESEGQTYQGFSYWYVVSSYQGNSYVFKFYSSDPPCSGVYSEGKGATGLGQGVTGVGIGRDVRGWGGYEERH